MVDHHHLVESLFLTYILAVPIVVPIVVLLLVPIVVLLLVPIVVLLLVPIVAPDLNKLFNYNVLNTL
jgi:hypothetical protein